jgi:hypothetical protein
MRFVAILGFLVDQITYYLFHPTYMLSEESGVWDALAAQAEADLLRERFCRSVLLAIVPNEQSQERKRKQKVIDKTWKILAGFAGSEPSVILNSLSTCVETAYEF